MKNKKTQSNIILDSQSEERIVIKELSNGLRVVAEEMPAHFPCSISISILSGSRDEIDVPNGTAHFLEHIVFRRTKRLKSKQIAKEFEKYGAIANAFTTKEYTSYFATANSNNLKKVFNLLYEVVLDPEFNQKDIDKERKIIIDEIVSAEEDPEDLITDKIAQMQFPNQQVSMPIAGSVATVNDINITHLNYFFEDTYNPNNIIIAYAGANIDYFFELIDKQEYRKNTKKKKKSKLKLSPASTLESDSNITNQTHLMLSIINNKCDNDIRTAFAMFNIMLSEAMSSRLYQTLRESRAITYNIFSGITNYTDFTELYIYTSFDNKKKARVLDIIKKEFDKLSKKSFAKTELKIAKELLKTYSLMENEGSLNKVSNLTRQIMLYNKIEDSKDILKSINEYPYEKIEEFTKETFNFDNWFKYMLIPD